MPNHLRAPLRPRPEGAEGLAYRARGRLVDRDAGFGQSLGEFKIVRMKNQHIHSAYRNDWFHTIVNTRSHRIFAVIVTVYILLFLAFAVLYMLASHQDGCFGELYEVTAGFNGTAIPTTVLRRFARATFFSIETMMTIGYGVDQWKTISDCPQLLLLIGLQSLVGIFASSILFGIVLTRVSRADQRACTVAFSDKAIVRAVSNQLYLVLRVVEMRKHQLVHAYAHAYAINDSGDVIGDTAAKDEGSSVHALPMQLVHPADEMMLMTPCFIVHRLDERSPLVPPEAAAFFSDTDSDPDLELPQLLRALQAQPSPADATEVRVVAPPTQTHTPSSIMSRMVMVKEHMLKVNAEVLVLLEGIDSTTSSSAQARQSYTADDICWDATFVPCARRQPDGGVRIDFDKLHAVRPLGSVLPTARAMRMPTMDLAQILESFSSSLDSVSTTTGSAALPAVGERQQAIDGPALQDPVVN